MPPGLGMAKVMSASGFLYPKATRVMRRILVFMEARMPARCFTMLFCRYTRAGASLGGHPRPRGRRWGISRPRRRRPTRPEP